MKRLIPKAQPVRLRTILLFVLFDLLAIVGSMALALVSVSDTHTIVFDLGLLYWFLLNIALVYVSFFALRVYFISPRTVGIFDSIKLYLAVVIVCLGNVVFAWTTSYLSPLACLIYSIILANVFILIRFAYRLYLAFRYMLKRYASDWVRVMVVGGGQAGSELIREMQTTDKIKYLPVCIVDDDPNKQGNTVGDVRIAGTTEDIPDLAEKFHVHEILIAMPSVSKKEIARIVNICRTTSRKVKILPGLYQLASGDASVSRLRDVEVTDLLGREQVRVNLEEITGYIENKVVLVTGGGGSIGSELCRQIVLAGKPKRLIILDIYENNAYDIEQELKRHYPELDLVTLIASVRDQTRMEDVFATYRPDIVFNAAAHKHVPLMETSPNEAVKNNVFGTLNCARLADKYNVGTFVQISTDKAVNPTNVMGTTKRICEMIIQTIGRHSKNTNFVAVRFGNVLGSNGSVIPLFKRQIAEGGPVTVTDPNIIRYFMTIPEAVLLVLQAGAYAKGGQIFVLDMGEPVKIYDLAVNLIRLSGLEPGVDIEIRCTGLRPGEKLYEERLMDEEGLQTTAHGLISVARPIDIDEEFLWKMLGELNDAVHVETRDIRALLKELVTTYTYKQE